MTSRRIAAALTVLGFLPVLTIRALGPASAIRLRTADGNRDGRPDVWQYYDESGALIRIVSDTNFDGRSDVEESYANGHLVRRETDRNFDDRVDLVDEFDATTGEHVRSVVDADFDGTADLLVLFANGKPVFSKWADVHPATSRGVVPGAAPSDRHADDPLWSLDDPFSTTHHFRAEVRASTRSAADAGSWSVARAFQVFSAAPETASTSRPSLLSLASASLSSPTLRGPPALTGPF
jgi:hypothetical protein